MRNYSSEFKEAAVVKLCRPGGPTVSALAAELGITTKSLYNWKHRYSSPSSPSQRPQDWPAEKKLKAVFEAEGLKGQELGAYLRTVGLHSHNIEEWRQTLVEASKTKRGRPRKDPELAAAQEENKLLKRKLRRMEKALAEQTALVILQKKVDALWGEPKDDEFD